MKNGNVTARQATVFKSACPNVRMFEPQSRLTNTRVEYAVYGRTPITLAERNWETDG